VRKTVPLLAASPRCASGASCVSYSTLGEPSKLSRGNPGPRCFACEKQRGEFEVEAAALKLKTVKHRQVKKPSRSEGYEPEVRSGAERFSELPTTERAGAALVGHQDAEVSRASAIRESSRASVLTCERRLQSALVSNDARLTRRWSRSLREARARLLWAEADRIIGANEIPPTSSTTDTTTSDQASQAAARPLIPPTLRSCPPVRCIMTPL